mmetsp:Transcript_39972/g.92737  ORF Transcript_39972/g.92737 Transcript_39972/m.92737 type:complete len:201 (+) Transcript_39972:950-1552(+)
MFQLHEDQSPIEEQGLLALPYALIPLCCLAVALSWQAQLFRLQHVHECRTLLVVVQCALQALLFEHLVTPQSQLVRPVYSLINSQVELVAWAPLYGKELKSPQLFGTGDELVSICEGVLLTSDNLHHVPNLHLPSCFLQRPRQRSAAHLGPLLARLGCASAESDRVAVVGTCEVLPVRLLDIGYLEVVLGRPRVVRGRQH